MLLRMRLLLLLVRLGADCLALDSTRFSWVIEIGSLNRNYKNYKTACQLIS